MYSPSSFSGFSGLYMCKYNEQYDSLQRQTVSNCQRLVFHGLPSLFVSSLWKGAKFSDPILNAWLELKTNGWPWPYRVLGPPPCRMFPDLAPHGVARGTHAKVRIVWGHKYLSLRLNFAARMTSPLNCIIISSSAKGKGGCWDINSIVLPCYLWCM